MKPLKPHDDLLARYNEAKAQWPDGLPDQPSAALHERIMHAASQQVSTTNLIALRANSMPAIGQNSLKNDQTRQTEASNDSFWNIRALGSLAVMGLAGLLWWQFEQGTPAELEAVRSAKPSTTIAAAPAPATGPTVAPALATLTSPAPAPSAESIAQPAVKAPPKLAQAKIAPQSAAKEAAEIAAPTAAPAPASETARARTLDADANVAPAPAVAHPMPPPPTPRSAAAPAPMAKSAQHAEKTTTDSSASGIQYAAPAAPSGSAPAAAAAAASASASASTSAVSNAPRVMAAPAPAPAARAVIASPDKLFQAIQAKDAAALRQALSQGASPNANAASRSPEGHPALTQAVIQRWPEGVRILLAAGADRNAKNNKGHTASDVAQELGDQEIIELLKAWR